MGERTHIDLFSGIGGFALAANAAGYRTRVFCEQDEFCRGILRHHWPATPIIDDIRNFDGTRWRGATLLTGGWPCQPVSNAGQRLGKEDHRWLWPELLRIIKESRPRWFLGENVTGIRNMGLDSCLSDLESAGYSVWPVVLPACAKNAPHRRDRFWVIARRIIDAERTDEDWFCLNCGLPVFWGCRCDHGEWLCKECGEYTYPFHHDFRDGCFHCGSRDVAHPGSSRSPVRVSGQDKREKGHAGIIDDDCGKGAGGQSRCPLPELGGVADGLPPRLFGHPGFDHEPEIPRVRRGIKKRKQKLMALGNSIVPHIAYEIIKLMEKAERQTP